MLIDFDETLQGSIQKIFYPIKLFVDYWGEKYVI